MKKQEQAVLRRILTFVLAAVMICCAFPSSVDAAAVKFSSKSTDDARVKALDLLMTCGFSVEYSSGGSQGEATKLTRWEDTINIYVYGKPAKQDLQDLNKFLMEIAVHCPNMPNIRLVESESESNVTIWYGPLKEMKDHLLSYTDGNWGYFSYLHSGYTMTRGTIAIATDVNNAASKKHLLQEELVGLFGLTNDHDRYSDSILYQAWTTTPQLCDVDWLMLNMLYDPDLRPGMTAKEAYNILEAKIWA